MPLEIRNYRPGGQQALGGGIVSTGLGVTVTDQGDAVRVPTRSACTA